MILRGHSGCLTNVSNDLKYFTKKTTDYGYAGRLYLQYVKQLSEYREAGASGRFAVPEPMFFIQNGDCAHFVMRNIPGECYIDFVTNSTIDEVDCLADDLCDYITNEISTSMLTPFNRDVFIDKYRSVVGGIESNVHVTRDGDLISMLSRCENVFLSLPEKLYLPTGKCHGDLTLTNMLFHEGKVYLIDFLDSYIDSPIIDVVKLRQDTRFGWGMVMCDGDVVYDTHKVESAMRRMDTIIVDAFDGYGWYRDYYRPLQILNMLRILPYAVNDSVITHVNNNIIQLLDE